MIFAKLNFTENVKYLKEGSGFEQVEKIFFEFKEQSGKFVKHEKLSTILTMKSHSAPSVVLTHDCN